MAQTSSHVFFLFSLLPSECIKEVWKGDMGTKGGAKEAESDGTEEEGANEEEGKTHDAGEL